jgi:hypothetical protein
VTHGKLCCVRGTACSRGIALPRCERSGIKGSPWNPQRFLATPLRPLEAFEVGATTRVDAERGRLRARKEFFGQSISGDAPIPPSGNWGWHDAPSRLRATFAGEKLGYDCQCDDLKFCGSLDGKLF